MATYVQTIPVPKTQSFFASAIRVLDSNVAVMALAFISGALIARKLGPEGQGTVAALLVYPIIFTSMAEMGIRQATVFHTGKKHFTDRDLIGAILALLVISGFIGMVACGVLITTLASVSHTPLLIALAVCYVPLKLIISYTSGYFLGKEHIGEFNRVAWLSELIRCLMVLLLVSGLAVGVPGAVAANLIGIGITAGYILYRLSRQMPLVFRWNPAVLAGLLKIGVVYAISLLVLQLNYQIHVVMLSHMSQTAQVGIYSLGMNLVITLWQLPNAIGTVLFARSANTVENPEFTRDVLRLARMAFLVVTAAALLLYVLSGRLVPLIFGDAYIPSITVVRMLLPIVVFFTIFRVLHMDLAGRGKPALVLFCTVPSLLLSIAIDWLLIPRYGALGAATAVTCGLGLATLIMIGIYCRQAGVSVLELLRYRKSDFAFLSRLRRNVA